ncbi:MAG TPA: Rieske 2Fe-2S domain-containing protein [Gemmatimonadaceae bacterium]
MPCKDCLNRRDFLAKSALAAAALVAVEGCGDGQIGPTAVPLGAGVTIALADFPDLATVGRLVAIPGNRAVVRTSASPSANAFEAFSAVCTHEGCLTEVRNNRFECPCHGSIFAIDGSVIQGPAASALPNRGVTFDSAAGKLTIA